MRLRPQPPRLVLTLVATALAAGMAFAPAAQAGFPAVPHHKKDLRAEVEAVDVQWRTAQSTNDAAAMDKLLSDDYLGITGAGQVVTKAQQLDRMRSRQTNMTRMEVSDVKIKLIGTSAAIVTSAAELEGTVDGRPVHGAFRSTRVYQHLLSGVWKVTSFEVTPTRPQLSGAATAGR
jgi:ketosteroid isomerase-like protein